MVNRVKGSSNYLDNWEKRREKKKKRIIYLGNEAKLDKGLKEIGNFENLYVGRVTGLDDGRKGWSKRG